MNCSPRLHQGLRAWLWPWPNVLWLHGGGTSRCEGRVCAHPLPPPSTLASFLLMRWRGMWESHTGSWPTPVHCRGWEVRKEAQEIKASLLMCAFWHKTDVDLTIGSIKHCWEPALRTLHHQRENSPTTHIISYLGELAVHVPTREAWDQMVWPTRAAIPHVPTEVESCNYCLGQVVDLSPMMPAVQFSVTEERGTYLCTTRVLVFKGSILTYNPTLNEAEWEPMHGLADNVSWAEERSAVALANYILCTAAEAERIPRLGAG